MTHPDKSRKHKVETWQIWLRRPKYFPRMRGGIHSSIHMLQVTPANAPKTLETKYHPAIHSPASRAVRWGTQGSSSPSASQVTMWSVADMTVIVFGGPQRSRIGQKKICRKFARKGSDARSPIVGADTG